VCTSPDFALAEFRRGAIFDRHSRHRVLATLPSVTDELEQQLSRIQVGDHLCLLYDRPEEVLPLAGRFLREGLDRGESAMYVVDDHPLEQVVAAFEEAGIDVAAETGAGRLRFITAREYCPLDTFEPQEMLDRFRALGDEIGRSGVPAVRAVVEMTWALTVGAPLDLLAEYECWGNRIFEHFTGMSLCMYNRRRFPPAAMERLLRAHPLVVFEGDVAPNPFYEPPEIFFAAGDASAERFDWLLDRLRRAGEDRRERERLALDRRQERDARRAAEEVSAHKSRFLAMMSHELRTPLNAVLGYRELLASGVAGALSEMQQAYLERIGVSARHLLGLIDEVLQTTRIEAGREELRPEPGDAAELAREIAAMLGPVAARRDLELRLELPDGSLPLVADLGKLRQILLNLVDNAIKYTDHGHVTLAVDDRDGAYEFTVADTGIGMTPAALEQAFDPFTRVHDDDPRRDGAGLGLAVCRSLADFLGAELHAESEPGQGSRFRLRVPAGIREPVDA
jgi:signal transduction histidine kinase